MVKERVLIVAPTGSDALNTQGALERAGLTAEACGSLAELNTKLLEGCGAVLLAEEALRGEAVNGFVGLLKTQPSWSDLPVLVVTSGGDTTQASVRAASVLGTEANIIFVERPFRSMTLISTIKSALRSRRRQYQVRDLVQNLELKVVERTLRLEQTISELEAFSYSVSHDLRAPLRAMQGYAHVLLEDFASQFDPTARDYLTRIMASAHRLDQLVQDLLTYSRAARSEFTFEKVDLHHLVSALVEQYPTFQPPNSKVTLRGRLEPVRAHEASLAQCVTNLLGNAVKFTSPGVHPAIEIWTERQNGRVTALFKDNGIGVPPEHQNRIFNIFERGTSDFEGTGIGLAIVKKAVERMDGSVGMRSNPEGGSTFWFELPAA